MDLDIIIPSTKTEIEKEEFLDNRNIKSVYIPSSVKSIGDGAFSGCTSLTSVTISDGVIEIGAGAFSDCTSLSSIIMPDSITKLGCSAFFGCSDLTSVIISRNVTAIDYSTFRRCCKLSSVTIPKGVSSIESGAFNGCTSLSSVTIPEGVKTIRYGAFCGCTNLTSVTIPNGVTSIERCAFEGCSSLTSVVIPNSVIIIGRHAFRKCTNLRNIIVPDGVNIELDAFKDTLWLKKQPNDVVYAGKVAYKYKGTIPGKCVVLRNGTERIADRAFRSKKLRSIVVPGTVRVIGDEVFMKCDEISYAVIPKSVIKMGHDPFPRHARLEIHWQPNPLAIALFSTYTYATLYLYKDEANSEKVEQLVASLRNDFRSDFKEIIIKDAASFKDAVVKCICAERWGYNDGGFSVAFDAFKDIAEIDKAIRGIRTTASQISTTVKPDQFSENPVIRTIRIPSTITAIEDFAFLNCKRLESVTIPESISEIGLNVFYGCENLRELHVDSTSPLLDDERYLKEEVLPEGCKIVKY